MEVLLCERVNDLRHSLFHFLNCLWALGISKSHREQALDYREAEELSWCPSWSNGLWQGWSCGLVHCPGGNATDPIWRVLASSDGISSWTTLKPQHSNPNLWPINSGVLTSLLLPHLSSSLTDRLPAFFESLMPLKNWCSIHARCSQSSLKHSISLKHTFIPYRSSKMSWRPDCIFEIHQLWQSGFSRVYSNCCCRC